MYKRQTEEAAIAIMANMSEEWKASIIAEAGAYVPSQVDDYNNRRDTLKNRYGQEVGPKIPGPSGGGQGGSSAPKAGVLKLAKGKSDSASKTA